MCDKMYLCIFKNNCPIGEGEELYNCCNVCEEPCENACALSRNECAGLVVFDSDEYCALRGCFNPVVPSECGVVA